MRTDLAVIGAGPAGLAASLAAAARGLRVTLIDAGQEPGGQYYRQPAAELRAGRPEALHHRWRTWTRLRDGLAASTVRVLTDHHVWCAERSPDGFTVHALVGPGQEQPVEVRATALLLATGGYETVLPFPGWTLPGVVTAGGAQAMLKAGLVVPGRTAVVAGTGPLLLPVATGLAASGVRVTALVESADPKHLMRYGGSLAGKLPEAAAYAARLLRHRVPVRARHTILRAHGDDRLTGVTVAALDPRGRIEPGTRRHLPCDTLAVSHGMLPHTDLAETLGCRLDGRGVAVDEQQRTGVPGVWAAGETTGVGGSQLSLAEGHVAGCSVAAHLTGTAFAPAPAALSSRTALRKAADALRRAYPPPARWTEQVTDGTVVCRCEEVTAGDIREALDLGAGDLRTAKLLTRAGMGWCQGRMCQPAVAGLAGLAGLDGCELTSSRRPFARPVPLGVLAAQHTGTVPAHPSGPDLTDAPHPAHGPGPTDAPHPENVPDAATGRTPERGPS